MMQTTQRQVLFATASVIAALLPVFGVINSVRQQDPTPMFIGFQYFAYSLLAIQIIGNLVAAKPVRQ